MKGRRSSNRAMVVVVVTSTRFTRTFHGGANEDEGGASTGPDLPKYKMCSRVEEFKSARARIKRLTNCSQSRSRSPLPSAQCPPNPNVDHDDGESIYVHAVHAGDASRDGPRLRGEEDDDETRVSRHENHDETTCYTDCYYMFTKTTSRDSIRQRAASV